MRAALIQMACRENPAENLERAIQLIRQAAGEKAQIVCLPELFLRRYFSTQVDPKFFELAEELNAKSTPALQQVARESGVALISGIFEKAYSGRTYNTAVLIDSEGRVLGSYRKCHIPFTPALKEKYYFHPGDLGFPVFETPAGKIGVFEGV